jgi:hypothetical protein
MNKENQCQSFTLKNAQCKNKCVDNFCRVHDIKECEKREKVRRIYREIEERSYRYLKYVEREVKKSRIRHRRWVERLEKKKENASVQCKALTKKGSPCQIATKSDYCHVHKHLDEKINESGMIIDITNNLSSKFYKVQSREYTGFETNPLKLNKIKDAYRDERFSIEDVYTEHIRIASSCLNIRELDGINDIILQSVDEIHRKTDEYISLIESEEDKSEIGLIISKLEKQKNQIQLREYKGPKLDSYNKRRIDNIYKSEVNEKKGIFDGMMQSLSYIEPEDEYEGTVESELNYAKNQMKIIEKTTDGKVKALIPSSKRKPLSDYY